MDVTFPFGRKTFDPGAASAEALWRRLVAALGADWAELPQRPVATPVDLPVLRAAIAGFDFERPVPPEEALDGAFSLLRDGMVRTAHPRYFGLFNPAPTLLSVLGQTLAAALNPQLAAWSHAPAACEMEAHVLRYLGGRLGYPADAVAGSFTSGGAEANLTAVLLALTTAFPDYATAGLRSLPGQPVLYASAESHLAWLKIAHATGLGRDALRLVPVGPQLRMDVAALRASITADRDAGACPLLVIGTAGTTSAGVIDPLPELADLAAEFGLRLHVDAAYGGAAALSDRLRPTLVGIERADSITVDAHKWFSTPMGAGALLCVDAAGLAETFRVQTSYMPADVADTVDPYTTSQQWSRRFAGLPLFLSLAVAGRSGYAEQFEHDAALGDRLRAGLSASDWTIVNDTPLPVVCFADPHGDHDYHAAIARSVVDNGCAWLSPTTLAGRSALRSCVISYRSTAEDVDALVSAVDDARRRVGRPA